MFFIGSTEEIAKMYWDNATTVAGPAVPEKVLEDMDESELKVAMAYLRIAYQNALNDEAPDEVIDYIVNEYDGVFHKLASISESFRDAVSKNRHIWIKGYTEENIAKYMRLAGLA